MRRAVAIAAAVGSLGLGGGAAAQVAREVAVPAIDYPAGITAGPDEYRVRVSYSLSPDGRVARCTVERRSGQPLLDAESCRILTSRARIRPTPGTQRGRIEFLWQDASALERPNLRGGPLPLGLFQVISADDYPAEAVRNRETGTTEYAATVSPVGRPTACRVTRSSGSERLDARSCELVMTRGAYIPSVDGAATSFGRITWRLP